MGDKINKEFEEFQKYLEKKEKKYKFLTKADAGDEFYKLIDEISGSNLSDETDRRNKNTRNK